MPKASGAKSRATIGAVKNTMPWAMALPPTSFSTLTMKTDGEDLSKRSPWLQVRHGRSSLFVNDQLDHLLIVEKPRTLRCWL